VINVLALQINHAFFQFCWAISRFQFSVTAQAALLLKDRGCGGVAKPHHHTPNTHMLSSFDFLKKKEPERLFSNFNHHSRIRPVIQIFRCRQIEDDAAVGGWRAEVACPQAIATGEQG
jgi:hypothetical protein